MKVKNAFYCRVEKKSYKVGDTYTGDRSKELYPLYLEKPKRKPAPKKENKKHPKAKIEKK